MKTIYHKIYIHPLFYLFGIISILTGQFKAFASFMTIILFHELGHILAALMLKWNIKRIIMLPFGCMTEFNEKLNRPIYQEFIILIAGPLFQMLLYLFYKTPYHYPLLLFNLLPIHPLDGSKFVFLLWNIIGSYYYSYIVTFVVSYLTIFILVFYYHNFMILIFSLYLMLTSISILKNKNYYFYTFLYERYLNSYPYYKEKIIKGRKYKKMKRGVKHYFFVDNKLIEEQYLFKLMLNLTNV